MASLTIRKLDDQTKQGLRAQAARNGRSMEEEARSALSRLYGSEANDQSAEGATWVDRIVTMFQEVGGVEIKALPRQKVRKPPTFS